MSKDSCKDGLWMGLQGTRSLPEEGFRSKTSMLVSSFLAFLSMTSTQWMCRMCQSHPVCSVLRFSKWDLSGYSGLPAWFCSSASLVWLHRWKWTLEGNDVCFPNFLKEHSSTYQTHNKGMGWNCNHILVQFCLWVHWVVFTGHAKNFHVE